MQLDMSTCKNTDLPHRHSRHYKNFDLVCDSKETCRNHLKEKNKISFLVHGLLEERLNWCACTVKGESLANRCIFLPNKRSSRVSGRKIGSVIRV